MRALALIVALAGCGDNFDDAGQLRSGDRLKLVWYAYEDGTRQRETRWYHDAERDEGCAPRVWSDGARYCTPDASEAVYREDTCTAAIARVPRGTPVNAYTATQFYLRGEPSLSRVFRVGAATSAPVRVWEKRDSGCWATLVDDVYDFYEVGEEIVATELARVRHGAARGDGPLAIVDDISDDGLRVPVAIYDHTAGVECSAFDRASAASLACVPANNARISYFSEVGCTDPKLAVPAGVRPPTARQYAPATSCWSYYVVGAQVDALPLYEAIGGTCVSTSPPDGNWFFTMAGPHEPPLLARVRESSPSRLQRIERVHEDLRLADPLLFDTMLDTECTHDAELRCAPVTDARVLPFFSDAQCQTAIEVAMVPSGTCDPPTRFARKGGDYHPVLAPFTGRLYELSTGDRCGFYSPPPPLVAYVIGAAVDPSLFVRAELTIDP